jgi:hypothetical protein
MTTVATAPLVPGGTAGDGQGRGTYPTPPMPPLPTVPPTPISPLLSVVKPRCARRRRSHQQRSSNHIESN